MGKIYRKYYTSNLGNIQVGKRKKDYVLAAKKLGFCGSNKKLTKSHGQKHDGAEKGSKRRDLGLRNAWFCWMGEAGCGLDGQEPGRRGFVGGVVAM